MAVNRKGKVVVDANAASLSPAAASPSASSSGGKRKRPTSAASASASSSRGGGFRGSGSGRKKRSRALASLFIDDAAVDADESDEFDDDGDGDSGEEDPESMHDGQAGVKDAKGAGKSNISLLLKEEELSGDELEDRYGHGSDHVMYDEDDKEYDDRKSLLHSTADPTIWRVRCMVGHERHIAFCLIQKYVSLYVRGSNLPIISVFSLEHIKGYVYIEADKQHDVAEACKGFCTLYTSKIGLVPTNEVPRLLSIQNKSSEIAVGMWVRMKNGKYKGDLAQVVAVDDVRKKATVKLVPRIDLQALAKKFGGGISLKQAAIPAPRLISSHELEDFRPHVEIRRDRETGELFDILDGLMLKDGYLYKKVSVLSLSCFGVQPSSAERMKFEPAKRDEPQVSEYISHLYGGHKKNSLETLDDSLEDKGDAFKLHDLVLFGRKDFGVVIAMKCDSYQILKGGVEEPVVVTVQRKDIKKSCIDKMFTASDSHMKTICINDTVKVLEGPEKDRQGIVKHMYKGTLFIYDEENPENTGFFCVKSALCEVTKDCHKNKGQKSCHIGSKEHVECSSMPQSPTKCCEQRDYDSGFKRYRQGDRDQPFNVGQTLRIRVGPLKGYLCRVVRIYRSEVTVKLDSLVKLITVNCNHLSDANIKSFGNTRDDTTSKPDEFGSQERLSKGELANGDIGEPPSKSSWDFELPSSSRASWQGLSTWASSSAKCDDIKACNDQGDDPWGSKVTSGDGGQAGHSDNAAEQRSQPATTDGWSNRAKAEKSAEGEHDSWKVNSTNEAEKGGWSKAMSSNHGQADSWNMGAGANGGSDGKGDWGGHTDRPGCFEAGQGFGSNWGKANTDGWSNWDKAEKPTEDESENWKGNGINEGETGGWNKATPSNHGQADGWNRGAGASGEFNSKSGWGSHTDRPGHFERGQGFGSNRGKAPADGWSNRNKAEKSTECEHESWKGNNINECEAGGSSKGMSSNHGQADGWNKGSGDSGESDGKGFWGACTNKPGHFEVEQGFSSSWAKATTGGWSKWNKAEKSTEGGSERWKGNNTNEGEPGGWGKARSSNHDQADRWNKGAGVDGESDAKFWGGHSDRSECFEAGQGFGCGNGRGGNRGNIGDRNQRGGWSKRPDVGWDHGSPWGRGRGRNSEAYESGDKQDCWNKSRVSDGRQGRGRGRGFDGSGHGGNQDDNWKGSTYSDASWSSGRGRGRGRRGRGVWEARGSRDDYNDLSHSGRDGKDHSFGWKNDWGSSRGDFSGDALSSWKSDQPSVSDVSTAFGKNEALDHKQDKNHSWGEKEPFAGGSSGWNIGGADHSATRNEGVSWERNGKPNMNQGCSSNSGWDGGKLGGGSDKHVEGEQPASWQKEATNNWSMPEVCKNKQSSWSHAPDGGQNAADEDWSIKPKPLRPSDWGQKSSGDETRKDASGGVGSWDNRKPSGHASNWSSQGFGGGNWNGPNPSSGGKQASDWHNDEGSNWNRPKEFGGRHSSGRNSWSVGDGARRNDDQSRDCSGGKSYGDDRSSGWKGNMSSGRGNGRGRGRCFGQERPGWSGGTHSTQEAGGGDVSEFSGTQEFSSSSKPACWTHDRFADKGSGSRDGQSGWSRGKDLAGGQSGDAKKGASGEEGWRQETKGTWGSGGSGTGNRASGSDNRSDWNNSAQGDSNPSNAKASAWTEGTTTSQDIGWEQKKCLDGAQGSDVWKSDAIPPKKASAEVCQGTDSWNKPKGYNSDAATGWNSATGPSKKAMFGEDQAWNQKMDSDRADGLGGWDKSNASIEEPCQNRMQRDTWSQENTHDGAHGSGDGSSWGRSKDGSAEKGGW